MPAASLRTAAGSGNTEPQSNLSGCGAIEIESFGIIHTADYLPLLRLTALAGVWHLVDILTGALTNLSSRQRSVTEHLFATHLRERIACVEGLFKSLDQAPATARNALCRDTSMVHAEELTLLLHRYVSGPPDLPGLRTHLHSRASGLASHLTKGTSYAEIAWCAPVLLLSSPVYHLELCATGVELRYSLDTS